MLLTALLNASILRLILLPATDQSYLTKTYPATVIEDGILDTAELLVKYNYPGETHYVTTADNYVLCMHRIARPGALPVLMMHGMTDSSATWILMGPWSGLGYYLYDHGYDIWMGNVRGNRYSRNHTIYDPDADVSFWTFSWHEMGIYDLPALIDYVLQQTGYPKLHYFGHSQGTTSFFVLASLRPDYNDKVIMMNAMAPVAFFGNIHNARLLPLAKNFLAVSKTTLQEVLPSSPFFRNLCLQSKQTEDLCVDAFFQVLGKDIKQTNMTMIPTVLGHLPAGCNLKQGEHYVQLVESGTFCQFNYGPKENQKRYGSRTPPDYPLQNIRVPIGLHYTLNDLLSSEIDVKILAKALPNVVMDKLYPYKKWNHMAVIWGVDARKLVHPAILKMMRKLERNHSLVPIDSGVVLKPKLAAPVEDAEVMQTTTEAVSPSTTATAEAADEAGKQSTEETNEMSENAAETEIEKT